MSAAAPINASVALITGGGSGIGAATARRLAAQGARVAIVDHRLEAAQAVASELGEAALAVQADVRREADVQAAVQAVVARFARLDVAVHAAGFGSSAEVIDLELADWQAVLDVDLTGVFLCTKHVARQMVRQPEGGAIVNIASTNAVQPGEGLSAYCVAKAGVVMFTQVAALELAPRGVRVNAIGPGLTHTPLTEPLLASQERRQAWLDKIPAGRAADAQEVAALVAFLCSPEAAYIHGETVYMDGGLRSRSYPTLRERRPGGYEGPAFLGGLQERAP